MPSCYICGAQIKQGEGYRRKVNTGHSYGASFGKRITPSVRSYYSTRTLCAACATRCDEAQATSNMITIIVVVVVVLFFIIAGSMH